MYGLREVEKLLRMPRGTINSLVKAGFVSPTRGPGRAWRFSFQDLIVLRTAQALAQANVPRQRITRSMRELRRHLPSAMPLSGLSICAVADQVVVREGRSRWQADSGQYLLAFEGDPEKGSLSVIERGDARHVFERALSLEEQGDQGAIDAYREAVEADPAFLDARINLGSALHDAGRLQEAESAYREALAACGEDPVLLYNLGVLLDDTGRKDEALAAYQKALAGDPGLADCHYNLALLCEELERPREAIRHMAEYRRLSGRKGGSPSRR